MPHRGRVVIIDDKSEDGEAIARQLWKAQVPNYFFHFDEENLAGLDEDKKLHGVRVIFQDIALVSPSNPNERDYASAQSGIMKLLHEKNGPWLLVAWSTWGDDPDKDDGYVKELFEYLRTRLPKSLMPYDFRVIDKAPFTVDGSHGEVKDQESLDQDDTTNLLADVQSALELNKPIEALCQWEGNVVTSAATVASTLWEMIVDDDKDPADIEKYLSGLLLELAKAQDNNLLASHDISRPLYEVLSNLLNDVVSQVNNKPVVLEDPTQKALDTAKLNTMIHWDGSTDHNIRAPGCVYSAPDSDSLDLGILSIKSENLKDFIVDSFMLNNEDKRKAAADDDNFLNNVKLVLLDITPPCDYSQDKIIWRKLMMGVQVFAEGKRHFYTSGGKKLAADYLLPNPTFNCEKGQYHFIFNSQLILPLPEKHEYASVREGESTEFESPLSRLELKGRIREQQLMIISNWYAGIATRPGAVSFR